MKRVFISYSRRNKTFAERLARDLVDAGLEVWFDLRQIEVGEKWQDEIYKGLQKSDTLVACLSPTFLTSEWCRREINTAREQGKAIVPLMVLECFDQLDDVPETAWLADIQFLKFENRYEEALAELVQALTPVPDPYDEVDPASIPNPFKGLEAFQQTDAHLFFGRETLVQKLVESVNPQRLTRFVAVVGASGTGKSSLVRAGLIPALRAGRIPGGERWHVLMITPGASPTEALAARLLPLLTEAVGEAGRQPPTLEEVADTLRRSAQSLHLMTEKILGALPGEHLLLVVDQFEELFTRATPVERERFVALLVAAATAANGRAIVALTMRADFFGGLSAHRPLADLMEKEGNLVIVTEMSPANLRRSVEGPAQAVGLNYEDGLVDRILQDVAAQPGALPLLQYALKELYLKRDGRRLTNAAYDAVGGVKQALARHAETIYDALTPAQQDIMERVLLRLVEINDKGEATRRRVARSEMLFRGVPDDAVQQVIDLLTAAESRLLIASRAIQVRTQDTPETTLEVSHEALIREWERFKSWVAGDLENLRFGSELLQTAHEWIRANRDPAYLLRGNRLLRAEAWIAVADVVPLQRELVQASSAEHARVQMRTRQRTRVFILGLMITAAAMTVLAAAAVVNANLAREALAVAERSSAESHSLALAAASSQAVRDNDIDLGLALALYATALDNPPSAAMRSLADAAYRPATRRIFTGQDAGVTTLAVSADGQLAVSGGSDGVVMVWNLVTGEVAWRLGSASPIMLQADTGEDAPAATPAPGTTGSTAVPLDVIGHTAAVNALVISPDGTRAISASADLGVILWDLTTGTQIWRVNETVFPLSALAFAPDGTRFATGNTRGQITLRSVSDGSLLGVEFSGHGSTVMALTYSPDGALLLSAGRADNVPSLWDAASGALVRVMGTGTAAHESSIASLTFSSDGVWVASGSTDRGAILWNVADGALMRRLSGVHQDTVTGAAFGADDDLLVTSSADGTLVVWDTLSGDMLTQLQGHTAALSAVTYLPADDGSVLSASLDGTLRLWDVDGSDVIITLDLIHDGVVNTVGVSGDGQVMVSGSLDTSLLLFDVATGTPRGSLLGHSSSVVGAALNADGTRALSGSSDQTLRWWDTTAGTTLLTMTHNAALSSVALSADGTRALSGTVDGVVTLWELSGGTTIWQSAPQSASVDALAFSADGTRAVSGGADGALILWNVADGTENRRFGTDGIAHQGKVTGVAFSPDGTTVVSASEDRVLLLWNVQTGALVQRFVGHTRAARAVSFSSDGLSVISGGLDNTLRLWDVASGTELRRYSAGARIFSAAFVPGGALGTRAAVSGDISGSLTVWRVFTSPDDLIDWTRQNRYVRPLTTLECAQFRVDDDTCS